MADIRKIAERPAEYLGETGMPMLSGGLVFFFLGSAVLAQGVLPPHNFVAQEAPKWAAIMLAASTLWISRAVRQKYVFPRGGYVELPSQRRRYWSAIAASVAILAVGLIGLVWRLRSFEIRFIWPGFAVLFAAGSIAEGIRQQKSLGIWFGIYLLGVAAFLWWVPSGDYQRAGWLQVTAGLPLAIHGAFRLRTFLKENPLPREDAHE